MSNHYDVIVIGSGPAGFTAALYASRSNLSVIAFEGQQPGGQLTITTDVENYPGFPDGIQGPEMMEIFRKQATRFGAKSVFETVEKIEFHEKPFRVRTERGEYTSKSIIVATGAKARLLDIPSEKEYWGAGISACATCDGFFFRGVPIVVIGGGDSAMEEALYLTNFGSSVTLVHRRDGFRASQIMVDRVMKHEKITVLTNKVVDEFVGETKNGIKQLTGVNLKDTKTGQTQLIEAAGAFLAIGHVPNTTLFEGELDMDENKYLITVPGSTYTNCPGIFAAGDVQDHVYRQAVTSAGSGCMAAIDAERWLREHS